jgi:hypothetical protein
MLKITFLKKFSILQGWPLNGITVIGIKMKQELPVPNYNFTPTSLTYYQSVNEISLSLALSDYIKWHL